VKKKILVAEDEEEILLFLKLILELGGYEVITARDGGICLSLYEKEKPDLVISDIKMPVLSGLEIYEKLKDKTKFIFVSGIVTEKDIPYELVERKMFFTKPIEPKGFVKRVSEVFSDG